MYRINPKKGFKSPQNKKFSPSLSYPRIFWNLSSLS